jgi:hypothetical protein
MGQLKLGGQILYKDMQTPAANARIQIWDLDQGGNGNDKIFEISTDRNGKFSGVSREWNDRNTIRISTPLGTITQEIFDTLMLEFRVFVDGQTHKGPYFHTANNASLPIVLPWLPIEKSQREVIHLITLSHDGMDAADELLYEGIEFGAALTSTSFLSSNYSKSHVLEKGQATLDNLCRQLETITSKSSIRAVDLIFSAHGLDGRVDFYPNVATSMGQVEEALLRIPNANRRKLRMLFSTACFSASHNEAWLRTGFEVVSGSIGVYADSLLSFPAFLSLWVGGATFKTAIDAANATDPLRIQDNLAIQKFEAAAREKRAEGNVESAEYYSDLARKTNSFRRISGDGDLKIFSAP